MKPKGLRMWRLHLELCYVVLHLFFVCLTAVSETCVTSCQVQNENGGLKSEDVCVFDYRNGACNTKSLLGLGAGESQRTINPNLLQIESWSINASISAADIKLKVNVTDDMVFIISDEYSNKCLVICFKIRPDEWRTTTLRASCIKFPDGRFDVMALAYTGGASTSSSSSRSNGDVSCSNLPMTYPAGSAVVLSHKRFPGIKSHRLLRYGYNRFKQKSRPKRVDKGPSMSLPTDDLVLNPKPSGSVRPSCPCYTCLSTRHHYDNETALLQLSYSIKDTETCCSNCSSLNLVLYQYVSVNEQKLCADLNFTTSVISGLRLVTQDKNVTQGPIEYPNVGSGCYAFRLRPTENPSPIYHGFFWLSSIGNVTNMNDWNTTFYLQPYPEQRSLEVKWTAPTYPYNFSHYELQLWHHRNFSIKCRGENLYDRPIEVLPQSGKISLTTTNHHFENLKSGWYCARVTPIDPRCPPDGCEPRSSLAKLLKEGSRCCDDDDDADEDVAPILIGAAAAGVLVAGVMLACLVLRCKASNGLFSVAYTKVNGDGRLGELQEVLLVWTAAGPDGTHLRPVVQAFKMVLSSYGRCKVYDYLDLKSIPSHQREQLLASPSAWLDSLLGQHRVKIIVVGTEGGRSRQQCWMTPVGGRAEVTSDLQAQDALLFPYLLRRLQDQPDLAADYSRVFHVRFSDISNDGAELEGVVSWTRYRLPQHLRSLILALHGIREDYNCLEEPTTDTIQPLYRALACHPLYKNISTANHNNSGCKHRDSPMIQTMLNKPSLSHPNAQNPNRPTNHSEGSLNSVPVQNENHFQNHHLQNHHLPDMTRRCQTQKSVNGTADDRQPTLVAESPSPEMLSSKRKPEREKRFQESKTDSGGDKEEVCPRGESSPASSTEMMDGVLTPNGAQNWRAVKQNGIKM